MTGSVTRRSLGILLCIALSVIIQFKASAQTIQHGDTVSLGAGFAFTWVETDAQNIPLRIGISFTADAISSPASGLHSVNFPQAASDSLFKHALFAYEPAGHAPPGIYDLPHFDMHFYMISKEQRETIAGGNDPTPIPDMFLPEDYYTHPSMGNFSVPQMGVHFVDSLAPELHGEEFDKTLLYGFYQAEMIFVEPMITKAFLLMQPDTTIQIKQPDAYQRTAYYPLNYTVRFNSQESLYEIFLTDLTLRTGVTSAEDQEPSSIQDYTLYQNYPNPFNPSTVISFAVPSESHVKIEIFNSLGELVAVPADGMVTAGNHSIRWEAGEAASGVYIYRLTAASDSRSFTSFKKMLLVR